VIFVSMLVYPLESARRFAAERCLWQLLCQLDRDDVLLTFEKPQASNRDEVWRLKPKVFGLGLAIAQKDEWVCWVDADIEFRDGFVKRLKEFLSCCPVVRCPVLCVTKFWERGKNNWGSDEQIRDYYQRAMLFEFEWDFYFGAGLIVANKAFLAYIDEWQVLTNRSQFCPEETALVTLAHKYRYKWHLVWLPDELHFVGWKFRQGEENAAAVHIGSNQLDRWLSYALRITKDASRITEVNNDAD